MLFLVEMVYLGIIIPTLENEENYIYKQALELWSEAVRAGTELKRLNLMSCDMR